MRENKWPFVLSHCIAVTRMQDDSEGNKKEAYEEYCVAMMTFRKLVKLRSVVFVMRGFLHVPSTK